MVSSVLKKNELPRLSNQSQQAHLKEQDVTSLEIRKKLLQRALIDHLPEQLRMDFALWTRQAVRRHQRINVLSSITNQGKVRFMLYEQSLNAELFIEFMKRLIRKAKGPIFLILDNLRVHHAKKVRAWADAHVEKIRLFYLPGYSPDLNPDEYLNCDLKAVIGSQPGARTLQRLTQSTRSHLRWVDNLMRLPC